MHRYQLMSQLGDGSFGVVSKAMHTQTGEVVAVKKMKQRFNTWEECLALREIQSLRRLQHPNLIKLKEVVRENTELFMIFEMMDQNVYQITRIRSEQVGAVQTIFNEKEIRSIVAQTLLGLVSIHKGGFMHRDLKPENLLTKGDVVKIADFGLAKEIRSRPPFTEYVSTRWYRAPEIILRSTHYNSPIDIWALGVIFAELYINRPLFPGSSDTDQLFKICSVLGAPSPQDWDEGHQLARRLNIRFPTVSPTPLRQLMFNASPAAVDLIEQMLRFNPQERPTVNQCLAHPFFTGGGTTDHSGNATVSSAMFQGISSGQPHNPFHMAQGLPGPGGHTSPSVPNPTSNNFAVGNANPPPLGNVGGAPSIGSSGGPGNSFQPPRRDSPNLGASHSTTHGGGFGAAGGAPNFYPGGGQTGQPAGAQPGQPGGHRLSGGAFGNTAQAPPGFNYGVSTGANSAAVAGGGFGQRSPPSPTQQFGTGAGGAYGGTANENFSGAGAGAGGYNYASGSYGRAPGSSSLPPNYHSRNSSQGGDENQY